MNPYTSEWVTGTLRAFAARAHEGEDDERLRDELLTLLWPWAVQTANRYAANLPPQADRDGVRSDVLLAVFQSVQRLDWDRCVSWPTFLRRRIHGARRDAARRDDFVSRRARQLRNHHRQLLAEHEQREQRSLRSGEDVQILDEALAQTDLQQTVSAALTGVTFVPIDALGPQHLVDGRTDPEGAAIEVSRCEAVHAWLRDDVPPALVGRLVGWLGQERQRDALPVRLARQIRPFLPALIVRIEGEPVRNAG